jgi:hypothetical protein
MKWKDFFDSLQYYVRFTTIDRTEFVPSKVVFPTAQLLRNTYEQRSVNKGYFDSNEADKVGRVLRGSRLAYDFIFLP